MKMVSVFASVTSSFETFEPSSALSGQKMSFRKWTWAREEIELTRDKF